MNLHSLESPPFSPESGIDEDSRTSSRSDLSASEATEYFYKISGAPIAPTSTPELPAQRVVKNRKKKGLRSITREQMSPIVVRVKKHLRRYSTEGYLSTKEIRIKFYSIFKFTLDQINFSKTAFYSGSLIDLVGHVVTKCPELENADSGVFGYVETLSNFLTNHKAKRVSEFVDRRSMIDHFL